MIKNKRQFNSRAAFCFFDETDNMDFYDKPQKNARNLFTPLTTTY